MVYSVLIDPFLWTRAIAEYRPIPYINQRVVFIYPLNWKKSTGVKVVVMHDPWHAEELGLRQTGWGAWS